jgi:hypothetical protein
MLADLPSLPCAKANGIFGGERRISIYLVQKLYVKNKRKAGRHFTLVQTQLNFVLCRHFIMCLLSKRKNGKQKYVNKTH